jgi:hypothetical protein
MKQVPVDHHDIIEILLNLTLITISVTLTSMHTCIGIDGTASEAIFFPIFATRRCANTFHLKAHFVVFKTYQFFIAEKCKNKLIPAI